MSSPIFGKRLVSPLPLKIQRPVHVPDVVRLIVLYGIVVLMMCVIVARLWYLQIAMGAAWFSLAAGEMIAAQYGLGFLILDAYNLIQYPTLVIAMATLGIMGYLSSAAIRTAGDRLMRWRLAALGGRR